MRDGVGSHFRRNAIAFEEAAVAKQLSLPAVVGKRGEVALGVSFRNLCPAYATSRRPNLTSIVRGVQPSIEIHEISLRIRNSTYQTMFLTILTLELAILYATKTKLNSNCCNKHCEVYMFF